MAEMGGRAIPFPKNVGPYPALLSSASAPAPRVSEAPRFGCCAARAAVFADAAGDGGFCGGGEGVL